jgi:hypothetical protein
MTGWNHRFHSVAPKFVECRTGQRGSFEEGQVPSGRQGQWKSLFGEDGAFRLVVPKDKRGARSIRMLTKLEVVQLRN